MTPMNDPLVSPGPPPAPQANTRDTDSRPGHIALNLVHESENEWLTSVGTKGVISDGRPFRMEVWKQGGMTAAHLFFSTRGSRRPHER